METETPQGEPLLIPGLGSLQKNEAGAIFFQRNNSHEIFKKAVRAERVTQDDDDHVVLVGDKMSKASEMTEYFTDDEDEEGGPGRWWIAALVLFILGAGAVLYHFNATGYSLNNFGNAQPLKVDSVDVSEYSRMIIPE